MEIIIRLILLGLSIWTGVMWFQTGELLWWGVSCIVLVIVFMASLGLDGTDIAFFD